MTDKLLPNRDAYVAEFVNFVEASPSSFHAAKRAGDLLEAAGFVRHEETAAWAPLVGGSRGFVVRDGAVIGWSAGAEVTATSPVRVLGAHTDSPGFVLKPSPDFMKAGWSQAGVEVYGGPLVNSWLDRDLGFAGRIVTRRGEEHLIRTGPVARIPQLAIHLDRSANEGLVLDRQRHLQPVLAVDAPETSVLELLAAGAAVEVFPDDIAGVNVRMYDTQAPARIGASGQFLASPRLDNLVSTFAGLVAVIESEPLAGTISVFAAFDHEEIGSQSRSGACGPFLEDVLERLRICLDAGGDDAARAMAASWCLSADVGHSIHPNYVERHDPDVYPVAGRGPMLKVNANQRYASDAHGSAMWRRACEVAEVESQVFVSNNSVACGSTIGPLTATRLGIRTVDIGSPILSMHSARELAHIDDLHTIARAISGFFSAA